MKVDFWFDPLCPFCWMTSRWLNRVTPERGLEVSWRSLSLLFKNEVDQENPFHEAFRRTTDLLRVVEAARDAGHEDKIGSLYTEFGRRIHNRGEMDFDVAEVLAQLRLDATLADALAEPAWDDAIRESMAEGFALTGQDVGAPLIAIDGRAGRVGFFGPVLTELPEVDEAVEIWDSVVRMAVTPYFYELKRTRTAHPVAPPESVLDSIAGTTHDERLKP